MQKSKNKPDKLNIVIAQIESPINQVKANTAKIIEILESSKKEYAADLIIFPELCITGYLAEDLFNNIEYIDSATRALTKIINNTTGITAILGSTNSNKKNLYNSAYLIKNKSIKHVYNKRSLPNYDIFDEKRYFTEGDKKYIFKFKNYSISLIICEDIWNNAIIKDLKKSKIDILICINASPYNGKKHEERLNIISNVSKLLDAYVIYVNNVGAENDMVFDGGSLIARSGKIIKQFAFFREQIDCFMINSNDINEHNQKPHFKLPTYEEMTYEALKMSLKNYFYKNKFEKVLVNISGGIDSSLVLSIAVDAIGKDKVIALFMPSQYTSDLSKEIVKTLIEHCSVEFIEIEIENTKNLMIKNLNKFLEKDSGKTLENIQARIRAVYSMGISNQRNALLVSTSNKSEIAVGYCTLYGDSIGGFALLADVYKTTVYRLAKYRNESSKIIPDQAIIRKPTAELSQDRYDENDLPQYAILDQIIEMYAEWGCSAEEIEFCGFDLNLVNRTIEMINKAEYKRKQLPIGPILTKKPFARGRRYPIL